MHVEPFPTIGSDTALGHGVQVTFLSINGVLHFDFYLQEGFGTPALL